MTNLKFEKGRLPDGSRVEVAREGNMIHIRKKDGSMSQLPVDRYLHGLVGMVERNSDRQLTGLEMTRAIVMAKWNKPEIWFGIIGVVLGISCVIFSWSLLRFV